MHDGIAHGGKNLYPAFPYTYFTRMSRADVDAIWAYVRTLPPTSQVKPPNKLPFPLNIRPLMAIWNALFFKPGEFRPNRAMSAEWNRGAYLVWGPGHCGGCHTPKNLLLADRNGHALQGATLDDWVALDLTEDPRRGLASWTQGDIVEFLRSGRNARTAASGSMQEVIYYSTSRMSDSDLAAIATYLKQLPPRRRVKGFNPPSEEAMRAGEAIYTDSCSGCHDDSGEGQPRYFPPLAGDASVQARDPTTIVRIILAGSRSVPTPAKPSAPAMPAFDWKLDDSEVASVATYVRNAWGNRAPPVASGKVAKLRRRYGQRAGHS
jgi:mono/diheme cytochrome c family protein